MPNTSADKELADEIIEAAEKIIDSVRDSGGPMIALPALAFATANLLNSVASIPVNGTVQLARDIFVRQLDAHLNEMTKGETVQ